MIITCEQCETRFELDPSKVPAKGARVRCSRCKHVFQVLPPTSDVADALEDVALSTAQEPVAAPEPSLDGPEWDTPERTGGDGDDPFADTMLGGRVDLSSPDQPAPPGHRTDAMELSSQEQDWEFNEEPPTAVVDAAAENAAEAGSWPDALESNAPPEPAAATAEAPPEVAAAPDTSPPLTDRRREASSGAEPDAFDASDALGDELGSLGALDDLDEPDDDPAEAGDDAGTTDEDLFGSFDDLLEDEPAPPSEARETRSASHDAEGFEASAPAEDLAAKASTEDAAPASRETRSPRSESEPRASRLPSLRWSPEWTQAIGGVVVAACLALGIAGVAAEALREPEVVPHRPGLVGPGLEIGSLGVRLVDNAHAGRILVVSGTLGHAVSDGRRSVRAVLLDAEGRRLQTSWAGPDLGEEWLREARPSEIVSELEARSGRFAFFGGRLQAVFPAPPEDATDFLFEEATRPPQPAPALPAEPTAQAADAGD